MSLPRRLVAVGASSGLLGVAYALAQHDLKRLLAYHSVENIGIIALGLGVGLLGKSYGLPAMACLGFAGAMLHVVNRGTAKQARHGVETYNLGTDEYVQVNDSIRFICGALGLKPAARR